MFKPELLSWDCFALKGVWQYLERFLVITWGRGCYWHIVGRGQGSTGQPPTTKNCQAQNVNSAETEKNLLILRVFQQPPRGPDRYIASPR